MRRADRLFLIIHALRGRRSALPARELAQTLGVSLRTVYRDVADLQVSGIPIEGEAGVGYVLRKGADLPPLMFNTEEMEALVVGARFVRAFAGERMACNAQAAMLKIDAVSPAKLREKARHIPVYAPVWDDADRRVFVGLMDTLHAAIAGRHVLSVEYADRQGASSAREIEPLCLAYWGGKWTVGAWCRMRAGFRNFRPDRMRSCLRLETRFEDHPARNLDAYFAAMRVRPSGQGRVRE